VSILPLYYNCLAAIILWISLLHTVMYQTDVQAAGNQLLRHVRYGDKDGVEFLLDNDGDINFRGKRGATPLFIASLEGKHDMAKFLLSKGADASLKADSGNTAEEMACTKYMKAIFAAHNSKQ
jgi:ankyrin repeat protein